MADEFSFGAWVRRRRRQLDLTQAALAARIGVAAITVQKLEADERRPSRQVAALLADALQVPKAERDAFLAAARGERAVDTLGHTRPADAAPPSHAAALPSGTVTFLFTDIAGSTRLWEEHPATMRLAVPRHDALLRAAVARHRGVVFKTVGDAVCAAFATAADGTLAAADGQRALAAEPWPEHGLPGPLVVRMALHSGAATPEGGDYLGPPLNRVARLLSLAHGGQILLSAAARELLGQPPDGLGMRELGAHRLRDIARPETVFQLTGGGLPDSFPPLRPEHVRPGNLPEALTSVLGRDGALAELSALLGGSARLVTLTGPGGTGKTTLALALARSLAHQAPDGAWFVDLSAVSDPAMVPAAVGQVLGVPELSAGDPLARLQTWLREQSLLVVLDNLEQVVACGPAVAALLRAAPRLTVIATSRVPLRISGECEVPVAPLELPQEDAHALADIQGHTAVQLFVERARAVRPDFALDEQSAPAAAAICRRLGGLPLAIELAAARLKLFTPEALLARLTAVGVLPMLTGGARDLPARQQTLRATVAWSYDLLEPQHRALMARCTVFAGGWSAEDAEDVCGTDDAGDVLDGLAALVDHSLVRAEHGHDGSVRFTLLETVREFAHERLGEQGDPEVVAERHARHFLAVAEAADPALRSAAQLEWLDRLDASAENLTAALRTLDQIDPEAGGRLALALALYWELRGRYAEALSWLERLLARMPDGALRTRTRLAYAVADFADKLTDSARSAQAYALAERLAEELGDSVLHAHGQILRAGGTGLGRPEMIASTLETLRADGDPWYIAEGLMVHAVHITYGGDITRGEALLTEGLVWNRRAGDRAQLAWLHFLLGQIATWRGELAVAAEHFAAMRELQERIRTQYGPAEYFMAMGNLAMLQGEYGEAERLQQLRLAHERQIGHRTGIAASLWQLGQVAMLQGNLTLAEHRFAEVMAIADEVAGTGYEPTSRIELGYVAARRGEVARAVELLLAGLAHPVAPPAERAYALEGLALAAARAGRGDLAAQLLGCASAQPWMDGVDLMRSRHLYQVSVIAEVQALLDEDAYRVAYDEGRRRPWDVLVAEVSGVVG